MATVMKFQRRFRRPYLFIRQHPVLTTFLLSTFILIIFYHEELSYAWYIRTINPEIYRNAVTLWSSDYHISPIHDLKNLLMPMGIQFFDKSLSNSCSQTRTCNSHLRILNKRNGMNPSNTVRQKFFNFYKNQIEMNLVDAIVCFHPASMCELYLPFNRSMIIIASTRYELGRFEPEEWRNWNENLKLIAQDPRHVIGANNLYDAEYIRYFTGIKVTLLPSFCDYTDADYNPTREDILLAHIHSQKFESLFMKLLKKSMDQASDHRIQIVRINDAYGRYEYSDLTNHPAIIHVPYQVSIMSLFEQYRMNIPLFFPSLNLLTDWHYEHAVVSERTWDLTLYGWRTNGSRISGMVSHTPDPNNEVDRDAIRYWLHFSDFYQWPHIIYFDSTDDLLEKLRSTDFRAVSARMKSYNADTRVNLLDKWNKILMNIRQHSKKFQQLYV